MTKVEQNFYVDNYLDSFNTEEEAMNISKQLAELLSKEGFDLVQWISSSRRVLAALPSGDLINPDLNLDLDQLPVERALGVLWNCQLDSFSFKTLKRDAVTKRQILSMISSIFDPLGFRSPVILTVERLLQEIWRSGTGWDQPIQTELLSEWQRLLSELRQFFWILRGRYTIKRVINRCFICRKKSAKPVPPIMSALPSQRLKVFEPPFFSTGIDYFGRLTVKIYRKTEKRWGCIFSCLTTRALHLELSNSLDTSSFPMSFRRFVSRRGTPKVCFSANGTNLVSGESEMRKCIDNWNKEKIAGAMAQRNVEWHFSPPSAPHFGGVWESLIKSAKSALKTVFKNRTVDDEILRTVLVEVESLLNGRPLTHISVDPDEPEALTPNYFLLGRAASNIPPDILLPSDFISRKRWRNAQVIVDHFWNRWLKEYVPSLMCNGSV